LLDLPAEISLHLHAIASHKNQELANLLKSTSFSSPNVVSKILKESQQLSRKFKNSETDSFKQMGSKSDKQYIDDRGDLSDKVRYQQQSHH
tara:strand:- start:649 stop:921 length:273 start_codon:yes stop_codon:yes gene_type:complete